MKSTMYKCAFNHCPVFISIRTLLLIFSYRTSADIFLKINAVSALNNSQTSHCMNEFFVCNPFFSSQMEVREIKSSTLRRSPENEFDGHIFDYLLIFKNFLHMHMYACNCKNTIGYLLTSSGSCNGYHQPW